MFKKTNNIIVSLRTIINGNVNVILWLKWCSSILFKYILLKDYSTLSPLYVPMEEHNNRTDTNNRRESIEFERSFLIGTQQWTYDYNDQFWIRFKCIDFIFLYKWILLLCYIFIGIVISPSKKRSVCIKEKKTFVLININWYWFIITEWPRIEHMQHKTV